MRKRVRIMDAKTELYGIIGNPVQHSLSPVIHNGAFGRMGRNAIYLAFEVKNLGEALNGIRGLGIRGVSVTIPFKTRVISFLDRLDHFAGKVKAVNTIANVGGDLVGYNTDCFGALEALEEKIDLKGKRVILLGAGGAARAIGFGLKEKGCQVVLFNRSRDRAEVLASELGCAHHSLSSLKEMDGDILVNATSVGMSPFDTASPVPKKVLREGMVVMDIVYRPVQTKLLEEAEEKGCITIDGLEMLARQGAAQLDIWTGWRQEVWQIKEDLWRVLEAERSD